MKKVSSHPGFEPLIGVQFTCTTDPAAPVMEIGEEDRENYRLRRYGHDRDASDHPSVLCSCGATVWVINGVVIHERMQSRRGF